MLTIAVYSWNKLIIKNPTTPYKKADINNSQSNAAKRLEYVVSLIINDFFIAKSLLVLCE